MQRAQSLLPVQEAARKHFENGATSAVVTKEQSCTNPELTTYTVTKEYDGKTFTDKKENVQTKAALEHSYTVTFTWADDTAECIVSVVCANDATHNFTDVATVEQNDTKTANCMVGL